jgi:hypothetical protein
MRALRIPTEGCAEVVDVDITLDWLQAQVGGPQRLVLVVTAGQRPADLLRWAHEIIRRYGA